MKGLFYYICLLMVRAMHLLALVMEGLVKWLRGDSPLGDEINRFWKDKG